MNRIAFSMKRGRGRKGEKGKIYSHQKWKDMFSIIMLFNQKSIVLCPQLSCTSHQFWNWVHLSDTSNITTWLGSLYGVSRLLRNLWALKSSHGRYGRIEVGIGGHTDIYHSILKADGSDICWHSSHGMLCLAWGATSIHRQENSNLWIKQMMLCFILLNRWGYHT